MGAGVCYAGEDVIEKKREVERRGDIPRLSAAMTTPSLNLMAITDVPVTMGACVCWFAPSGCMYEWS